MKVDLDQEREPNNRVYLRFEGVQNPLSNPTFTMKWNNQFLGPKGWQQDRFVIVADQTVVGQSLHLWLPGSMADYLLSGQSVQVEVPELDERPMVMPTRFRRIRSASRAQPADDRTVRVPDSSPPTPLREDQVKATNAERQLPPSDNEPLRPNAAPPPNPDAKGAAGNDAKDSSNTVPGGRGGPSWLGGASQPNAEEAPQPPSPPPPNSNPSFWRRSLVPGGVGVAIAVVFFFGGWMAHHWTYGGSGGAIPLVVQRQAFSPFDLRFEELRDQSPMGRHPNSVAEQGTLERGTHFYNYGRAASANGKLTEESVYWFKQSAKLCEVASIYALGVAYWKGEGTPSDRVVGYQLLRIAAAMGLPQAKEYIRTLRPDGD